MKTLLAVPFALALLCLPTTPAADAAGPNDWMVDGGHSSVTFRIKHMGASWFTGAFDSVGGTVTLDPKKPEATSVKIAIPVDSVDTNNAQRDGHLKNADFFNAKENPEITFASTAVKAKGDDLEIAGELALAGKSKAVTIVAQKVGASEMKGKRVGYSSEFTIKRSDFGMNYGVEGGALGDEVTMRLDLVLVPAK
jgi:polyisoprenoid-binding protein YceI